MIRFLVFMNNINLCSPLSLTNLNKDGMHNSEREHSLIELWVHTDTIP